MAELTPKGYKLKPLNQWFQEERALYLSIDPRWNLDPSTPDGLKIAHDAEIFSALDETIQQAYNSKDPNKAQGIELDIVCSLTGTRRSEGTPSNVDLLFRGVPGSLILEDCIVESTATGSRWVVNQSYAIDSNGEALVPARCVVIGPTHAAPGTITKIVTVMSGITSVTNPDPATPGTSIENDSSLRLKRRAAVGRPGSNQVSAQLGEIIAVDGVRRVRIYENTTDSSAVDPVFNPHGLPPHSTATIVDGGADDDVAMALYIKKNPGHFMADTGDPVVVIVTDPKYPTNRQPIRFNRPIYVDMVIEIEISDPDSSLPENADTLIKQAFMDFATGELTSASCGFRDRGFDIGESVPYSTLYTPINKIIEPYGNAYVSLLKVNGSTSNQVIKYNELSRWTEDNITVSVTS